MKKLMIVSTTLLFILFTISCENAYNPMEPTNSTHASLAKQTDPVDVEINSSKGGKNKVEICHLTGNGKFITIQVDANAVPAHKAHGDLVPLDGEWVFYMNNNPVGHYYNFDTGIGYYPYSPPADWSGYNVNEVISLNKVSCDDMTISFVSTYVLPGDLIGTILKVSGDPDTMTGFTEISRDGGLTWTKTIVWEAYPIL